jgi:hypothetical protein
LYAAALGLLFAGIRYVEYDDPILEIGLLGRRLLSARTNQPDLPVITSLVIMGRSPA